MGRPVQRNKGPPGEGDKLRDTTKTPGEMVSRDQISKGPSGPWSPKEPFSLPALREALSQLLSRPPVEITSPVRGLTRPAKKTLSAPHVTLLPCGTCCKL